MSQSGAVATEQGKPAGKSVAAGVLGLAALVTGYVYWDVFVWMYSNWQSNDDYSHGFFIAPFAAYLLWSNRDSFPSTDSRSRGSRMKWDIGLGLLLVVLAVAMRVGGMYARIQTVEGVSLIPFLLGLVCLIYGWPATRWAFPGVAFLLFMVPLPAVIAGQMSGVLQMLATQVSAFTLQTVGIPAVPEGNIITLSNGQIGVAEACSGLRMLYAFFALTVGACQIIERSLLEKLVIAASAIPIAIAANWLRIFATGVAFEYFDPETAKHIFHDVAGWLMMPIGFLLLLGFLGIMDRLILPADDDDELPGLSTAR